MEIDTPAPAATGAAPLSDILDARATAPVVDQDRGAVAQDPPAPAPAAAPAAPAASAQPAPTAAPSPAPQAQPDPASDAKAPKWYRDHMAQVNRDRAAERAEVERLRASAPQPQPRPQAPANNLPDPLEDPQGYAEAIQADFERRMQVTQLTTTLTVSERFAKQQHGGEAFEECRAWLSTKPDVEQWCLGQPDPWGSAFTQYQRERLSEEIGDDPNAWRDRERERIRAELQAELSAAPNPAPAPQMRSSPPPSASTVRSTAPRDGQGRFAGPAPVGDVLKNKF